MVCSLCAKQRDKAKATLIVHNKNKPDEKHPICEECYNSGWRGEIEMLGGMDG